MSNQIKSAYPDNWPFGAPHKHPEGDVPPPFKGFDVEVPEDGTAISNLAYSMREAKRALNSVVSVPALFSYDVEDGDLVIPLPCEDSCNENCDELLKTLRDLGNVPDAVWIPALRETTDSSISTISSVDLTTYDPPFYGVAYKAVGRVMIGPVVAHPRFKFHTGDKVYADKNGDLTTTPNNTMVGVCLAPGAIYLSQYASTLKEAMEDLYANAIRDTVNNIEQGGLNGDNIAVTTDSTTTYRPLDVRFGDVVNVKDFGAVGDGTTDDTAAFNAAIVRAQQLGSNICLFIPVGTYLVTELPNVPCYGPGSVKYASYTYSPFELLFKINGAIQKDINGRYKVDFSSMTNEERATIVGNIVQAGGGLSIDENGKIYVDFDSMPTDKFEAMLKSIRVPIWLTQDLTIYVSTTGSDTLDEGRGLTEDKPFKTVQAALQYVADTYNISDRAVTVVIAAGDYGRTTIILPDYQSTTGSIELKGVQGSAEVVKLGRIVLGYAKDYYVSDLTTRCRDFATGIFGSLEASNGVLHLRNVICDLTDVSYTGGSLWALYAHRMGQIMVWASSSTSLTTGVILKAEGKEIDGFMLASEGGIITYAADINIIGDTTVKSSTVKASSLSQIIRSNSSLENPGRVPNVNVTGTITGVRYNVNQLSLISTRAAGADYYPGSLEGVILSGGQYT